MALLLPIETSDFCCEFRCDFRLLIDAKEWFAVNLVNDRRECECP